MATSLDQSDFIKTALRLPRDTHVKLQAFAEANGTSLNSEIVRRLQESLNTPTTEIGQKSLEAVRLIVREEVKRR